MQVKSIAGCILKYFWPSLSYHLSLRSLFLSIFEWPFYTGFTVDYFMDRILKFGSMCILITQPYQVLCKRKVSLHICVFLLNGCLLVIEQLVYIYIIEVLSMYANIMIVKKKFLRKCFKIIYRWCYGCACICFEKVKKGDDERKKVFLFDF